MSLRSTRADVVFAGGGRDSGRAGLLPAGAASHVRGLVRGAFRSLASWVSWTCVLVFILRAKEFVACSIAHS